MPARIGRAEPAGGAGISRGKAVDRDVPRKEAPRHARPIGEHDSAARRGDGFESLAWPPR